MRRILVDHARRHHAGKRGSGLDMLPLNEAAIAVEERAEMLIALDEALERLGALDARMCRVVECRYFAGLSDEETAEALGVSSRTVRRDWVKAAGGSSRSSKAERLRYGSRLRPLDLRVRRLPLNAPMSQPSSALGMRGSSYGRGKPRWSPLSPGQ